MLSLEHASEEVLFIIADPTHGYIGCCATRLVHPDRDMLQRSPLHFVNGGGAAKSDWEEGATSVGARIKVHAQDFAGAGLHFQALAVLDMEFECQTTNSTVRQRFRRSDNEIDCQTTNSTVRQ
jgi:hypothetical protein